MDRVVNCLYRAPGLSTAMATLMTSLTQHKITYGTDNNTFQFELEDIMVILKSHQIKLSHNLHPKIKKANIAALDKEKGSDPPVPARDPRPPPQSITPDKKYTGFQKKPFIGK